MAPETVCPECGHGPVTPESCPACGAKFRELPTWRRSLQLNYGRAIQSSEDSEATTFDPQERGETARRPHAMVALTLVLSGYWALRAVGLYGPVVFEPRLLWVGVVAPAVVAVALLSRRGGRAATYVLQPVAAALAVVLAFPDWLRPSALAVAAANLMPLLGVAGNPTAVRRVATLASGLLLLTGGVVLGEFGGRPAEATTIVDANAGLELALPAGMRLVSAAAAAAYCRVPDADVAAAFEDASSGVGGILVVAKGESFAAFRERVLKEVGTYQKDQVDEPLAGTLAALTQETLEVRVNASGQARRGLVAFVRTSDARNLAVVVTASGAAFPQVRMTLRRIGEGLAIAPR